MFPSTKSTEGGGENPVGLHHFLVIWTVPHSGLAEHRHCFRKLWPHPLELIHALSRVRHISGGPHRKLGVLLTLELDGCEVWIIEPFGHRLPKGIPGTCLEFMPAARRTGERRGHLGEVQAREGKKLSKIHGTNLFSGRSSRRRKPSLSSAMACQRRGP